MFVISFYPSISLSISLFFVKIIRNRNCQNQNSWMDLVLCVNWGMSIGVTPGKFIIYRSLNHCPNDFNFNGFFNFVVVVFYWYFHQVQEWHKILFHNYSNEINKSPYFDICMLLTTMAKIRVWSARNEHTNVTKEKK